MKKFVTALLAIAMALSLAACGGNADSSSSSGKKFDSNKGVSAELGCELSDYLFFESKDKVNKFIEDNELQYDEENGDYFNHYISIKTNEDASSITLASLVNPGNYTLFGINIGETFDRDIVTNRLNRNNLPLLSDEGDYIYYGASGVDNTPMLGVRLNDDGTVGFVVYDAEGGSQITSNAEDSTEADMTAPEIYRNLAETLFADGSGFHGSFTEKALTFIDNHPNLFIGGDPENESSAYMSNEWFDYRKYAKSAENYPLTIIDGYETYVLEISETNLNDSMCLSEGIITDFDSITNQEVAYYFFMPGSIDVYNGDYVNFAALPLGYGSYDSTDGGSVKCVFLAVTSMWVYEEAPDQGF